MNIAKLLDKRRSNWGELERLCEAMEVRGRTDKAGPQYKGAAGIVRFARLYRGACADLALADAYQLPPATVTYLHRLVARSHNQLYRAGKFEPTGWFDMIFRVAPKEIYGDNCVRVATLVFFGLFALSMYLGYQQTLFPNFANVVVGEAGLQSMEEMYEMDLQGSLDHYITMSSFYIMHNTGIGLKCFAYGILIVPCLYILSSNAVTLGTVFGYMAREDVSSRDNFFEFVTAHGPFELTAIALSAAAGLRLGMGLFATGGLSRIDSVRRSAVKAVPVISAAATLFVLAAFTEGFISPSPLAYTFKAAWSVMSSSMISFYFVVLGFPGNRDHRTVRQTLDTIMNDLGPPDDFDPNLQADPSGGGSSSVRAA
ncbi:stage II sporulation protein M [Rhodopirellula europaea]|uniref:Integral membrane protein n=1 Tax=Rhodopirellula europaea SH398 TaxID=1263868 RepID=M5RX67_9BACT|nr:stage II sporulation protein M [Rhodopirellula europaea]EMI23943.1 Integral membrane protein [Rhodopirellula europaea SH398]